MSLLVNALKSSSILDNGGIGSSKLISVPTGFTIIDVLGGNIEVREDGVCVLNGGVTNRSYSGVGESSTGKSTIEIQKAAHGCDWWNRKYPDRDASDVFFLNLENNVPIERYKLLTNWSDADCLKHLVKIDGSMSTTAIYNLIVQIAAMKHKNKEKYIVETDLRDIDGTPVKSYIFTYFIIDSIVAMKNVNTVDDYEKDRDGNIKYNEAISGNIDAMREAKESTDFILKVKPLCEKYGIVLTMINHVVDEPKLSMFDVPKKYLPFLKPGKRTKGSKELIFQSYGISDLVAKEKINEKNPIYGDSIHGFAAEIAYIKNKANYEGIYYRMIFDGATGYRAELSDFEYLYNNNSYGLGGSPAKYYLHLLPEISFTRKKLLDLCKENVLLARALQLTAKTLMVHDLILQEKAPDLSKIAENMSFEERVAMIVAMSSPYPGYERNGYELDENILKIYEIHRKFVANTVSRDIENAFLTNLYLELITPDEDGLSFMPSVIKGINPFNMDKYLLKFGEDEYVGVLQY